MNKLHKKRIQKWVDALKSGEYKQGQSRLRNIENKYCCLGVACDIYEKQTKQKLSTRKWAYAYLPEEVEAFSKTYAKMMVRFYEMAEKLETNK